jgi:hypothetical protein
MSVSDTVGLKPQLEEQITELRWVGPGEFKGVLSHTFPGIRDVIQCANS